MPYSIYEFAAPWRQQVIKSYNGNCYSSFEKRCEM